MVHETVPPVRSRFSWTLMVSILAFAAYLMLGLSTLRVEGFPRIIKNGADASEEGGIQFLVPGLARSKGAPTWLPVASEVNAIEVELEARSASARQCGPARVFTISSNTKRRNLTIAQQETDLVLRLRTSGSNLNGEPPYVLSGVFGDADLHTILVTIRADSLRITVDGEPALERSLPVNSLTSWDPGYVVVLGNEVGGRRPWLGEIRRATVRVMDEVFEYANREVLEIPSYYLTLGSGWQCSPRGAGEGSLWSQVATRWPLRDLIFNFLIFVPLGGALVFLWRRVSILTVAMLCGALSLSIEVGQIFVQGHYPQVSDVAFNILGGGLGAVLARGAVFAFRLVVPAAVPSDKVEGPPA